MTSTILAFTFATALLSSQHLITLVSGAPLPEAYSRWLNPCGGSSPTAGSSIIPLPTPPPPPIKTQLLTLNFSTHTALSLTEEILYTVKLRIGHSAADALETYPSLTGFPNTNASFTTGITIEDMMQNEVERVSEIGVFLEQARNDTYDYKDKIKQLENKYTQMLCQMHQILHHLNQEVTSNVSRDIMSDEYRNLDQISQIDQRNYLIIRDARKIYSSISEGIKAYITENNL